ncbi:hypothetical protein MTO96_016919 [Rhipicephalus appendiculatus]
MDRATSSNIGHNASSFKGIRLQAVATPRGTGRPHIRSARKPRTRRLDTGTNAHLQVVQVGAVDSEDSLGDLAREPRTHLLCTRPCLLAEAGYPKQLHLEATCAHRREAGRLLGHGLPRRLPAEQLQFLQGPAVSPLANLFGLTSWWRSPCCRPGRVQAHQLVSPAASDR